MWLVSFSEDDAIWGRSYAGAPLSDNVAYEWRAKSEFSGDYIGVWSDFVTFTPIINDAPTATVATPSGTVTSLTPSVTVNFSDPDSNSPANRFDAYQIQVRRKSDSVSFWDPGQAATTSGQQSANQAIVTYAGTTLVSGTTYQVRARVLDGGGLWSDYSAWQDFTPAVGPGAPTGITPSGLTNTLTPTISGTYVQGTGSTESDFQYEVQQNGVYVYQSGDVTTDIATGQAYGTNNSGDTPSSPPALAWGTAYTIRVRSKDALGAYGPWTSWQAFNTNAAPTTATAMAPGNNAIISDTTPDLSWVHNDPDADAQTAVEVELYNVSGSAYVTGYNPKALTQSTLTHTVTETLSASPTNYRWRIRTKGLAGPGFGPWSDWAPFTVATAPTVTLTEPDPAEVISTPAYTVTWTFSGGTQQDYRLRVYASDQATVVYDSGVVAGTALTHQVPSGTLHNGNTYFFRLTARDTLSVEGDSGYVETTTAWTPPATISGITASAVGGDA